MKSYIDSNDVYRRADNLAHRLMETLPYSISTARGAIKQAMLELLEAEDARRSGRRCNKLAEGADLATDVRGSDGLRRYDLGAVGDEPCMVPGKEGRWVLAADVSQDARDELNKRIGL